MSSLKGLRWLFGSPIPSCLVGWNTLLFLELIPFHVVALLRRHQTDMASPMPWGHKCWRHSTFTASLGSPCRLPCRLSPATHLASDAVLNHKRRFQNPFIPVSSMKPEPYGWCGQVPVSAWDGAWTPPPWIAFPCTLPCLLLTVTDNPLGLFFLWGAGLPGWALVLMTPLISTSPRFFQHKPWLQHYIPECSLICELLFFSSCIQHCLVYLVFICWEEFLF